MSKTDWSLTLLEQPFRQSSVVRPPSQMVVNKRLSHVITVSPLSSEFFIRRHKCHPLMIFAFFYLFSVWRTSECGSRPRRPLLARQVRRSELRKPGGMQLDRDGTRIWQGAYPLSELRSGARAGLRLRLHPDYGRIRDKPQLGKVLWKQGASFCFSFPSTIPGREKIEISFYSIQITF